MANEQIVTTNNSDVLTEKPLDQSTPIDTTVIEPVINKQVAPPVKNGLTVNSNQLKIDKASTPLVSTQSKVTQVQSPVQPEVTQLEEIQVQPKVLFDTIANKSVMTQLTESLAVLKDPMSYNQPNKIINAQLVIYQKFLFLMVQNDIEFVKSFYLDFLQYIFENPKQYISSRAFIHINDISGLTDTQRLEWETLLQLSIELANPKTRRQTANSINWEHISQNFGTRYRETLLNNIKLSIGA